MSTIDETGKLRAPAADSALTELMTQVLGNKADTALIAYTAADSMMRYVKGLIDQAATLTTRLSAVRAAYLDELAAANIPADIDTLLTRLPAVLSAARIAYLDNLAPTALGRLQVAKTTISLNQAAGTYDLFTGTTQTVILESLNIKMPTGAAGGAITSISIQTDDVTPGVIIDSVLGAVANLTSEADLGWVGTLYITVATKIRLTIAGGAHGSAYTCNVTAKCRAATAGGYLA